MNNIRKAVMASSLLVGMAIGLWPSAAVAGCGTDDCTNTMGEWFGRCCIDTFAGCKKYTYRLCQGGKEYRFLATYQGQCNEDTKKCEYPDGSSAEEPG